MNKRLLADGPVPELPRPKKESISCGDLFLGRIQRLRASETTGDSGQKIQRVGVDRCVELNDEFIEGLKSDHVYWVGN